jgi:hypothetical protein
VRTATTLFITHRDRTIAATHETRLFPAWHAAWKEHDVMNRTWTLLLALASQGCSLVIGDTHCFDEVCADASTDAQLDAPSTKDASMDADAAPDVKDAAPEAMPPEASPDANDVCLQFTLDPCRNVPSGSGGCYCGASTQGGFDTANANPNCIDRCNDSTSPTHTDSVKTCGGACAVAPPGTEDYCSGQSACSVSVSYCYAHCTD